MVFNNGLHDSLTQIGVNGLDFRSFLLEVFHTPIRDILASFPVLLHYHMSIQRQYTVNDSDVHPNSRQPNRV